MSRNPYPCDSPEPLRTDADKRDQLKTPVLEILSNDVTGLKLDSSYLKRYREPRLLR